MQDPTCEEIAFYQTGDFLFVHELETNWQKIANEYQSVKEKFMDWYERDLYGTGWQVFGLYDFPDGAEIVANTALCPITSELISKHIPNHGAAGFSRLQAGTRIRTHTGYAGPFLRCHLGLEVPDGDCILEVAGEKRQWSNGLTLVFDDRLPHSAWNLTDQERIVLLVDFKQQSG